MDEKMLVGQQKPLNDLNFMASQDPQIFNTMMLLGMEKNP